MACRRRTGVGKLHETVQDGQRESRCFTRAGLGSAHDITAIDHDGNGFGLNGCGRGVARVGHGLQDAGVQAEVGERGDGRFGSWRSMGH